MQRYIDELQLLHAIQLAVVATDDEGRITFANGAAEQLYGGSRERLAGTRLADLLTDPGSATEVEDALAQVLAGQLWRAELSLRPLAGDPVLARMAATPLLDAEQRPVGMVVVAEDITDLRLAEAEKEASEQRLRLAHRAAQLGTWHWDMASGTNVWDERLEEIFGLPPGGFEGTFEAWRDLLHPEDVDRVLAVVQQAMDARSSYLLRNRVLWPDGRTVRSIEAYGQVTTDADGNPTGTIGCVRDVTDEVETQRALEVSLEAERQAARRTGLLLAVTADLSGAGTLVEVERVLAVHLDQFARAFGDRTALTMPASLLEVHDGRDLVTDGYDGLDPDDRTLLDGLASQCRVAAQRAALLAHTSRIAEDLQHSLAASPLPAADDVDLAVHYAPGGSELEHVGGDWYDAVRTRDGRLALVVGDVMGRGVRAATTMIRVRAGLRGLITVDPEPGHLLTFADDLLARDAPEQFVTAAAALLDPATGDLRLCLAGHVPLVAVLPDGETRLLGLDSGIPLGVQTGVGRTPEDVRLPSGTILVMVTDGVVESRDADLGEGIDRLRRTAAELRTRPLAELVAGLGHLTDPSMRDDVTVLALRVH